MLSIFVSTPRLIYPSTLSPLSLHSSIEIEHHCCSKTRDKDWTMSQNQQSSGQQSRQTGDSSRSGKEPSKGKSDEWSDVKDPSERRKIQNKLAQRRFRK